VAHTYIDLRSAQARLASAQVDARARTDTAALVELRYSWRCLSLRSGARRVTGPNGSKRARRLQSDARAAAYSLALLTGRPPEALIALPISPPPGHDSTWHWRRPAVGASAATSGCAAGGTDLAASTADIGVATADLFPKISLIGAIGVQATTHRVT